MQPDERTLARLKAGCICKGVKLIRLIEAIENGATTFAQVAAVTGIGNGPCRGKRCREKVAALLARQRPGQLSTGSEDEAAPETGIGTEKMKTSNN